MKSGDKPAFPLRVTTAFDAVLNRQMKFGDRAKLPFAWNTYQPYLFEKGPDALIKIVEREAARMRKEFTRAIRSFVPQLGPRECANYFKHAGYASI